MARYHPKQLKISNPPSLWNWQQIVVLWNPRMDENIASAYYKCWLRFFKKINPAFDKYNERKQGTSNDLWTWEDF